MISCFTVTQEGRLDVLAHAIADFRRQSVSDRELVVVHDGGDVFHAGVSRLSSAAGEAPVRVMRVAPGRTLGALRNVAVDESRGEYVCQWDDDDRYHPLRLEAQLDALLAAKADCSFLSDQLHLFVPMREMYWDDWHEEPYPLNFAPGTLFGRRNLLARYPDLKRGEDSALCVAMLREGRTFARTRERGWLYVYRFDGRNSFDQVHHASISLRRSFRGPKLLQHEAELRARIAEYTPPLGPFTMPYEGGHFALA
jgi:glycosyltransferase involved in cell wall biosynthesis